MANEKLTGAFLELFKVTGIGGSEVETLIAYTVDDVSIDFNPVVAEVTPHQTRRQINKAISDAPTFTITGLLTATWSALTALGIVDGTNKIRGFVSANLEGIRLKVYENFGDGAPKIKVLCQDVTVLVNNIELPSEDFATWNGEFRVGGEITKET